MIRSAVGLALLLLFFCQVDWVQMKKVGAQFNILLLFTAFVLNIPQILLKSYRWRYLLFLQGYRLSLRRAFQYYLSSIFLGVITPGRLGEFAKVYYLMTEKRAGGGVAALSSVIIDRLMDLYLLLITSLIGFIVLPALNKFEWLGWGGILVSITLPVILKRMINYPYFWNKVKKIFETKNLIELKSDNINSIIRLVSFHKSLLWAGVMTVLSYALFFFQCYLIAISLCIPISYFLMIPVMALTNIASLIPISISGVGTRDSALIFILGQQGISLESSLALSIGILLVFYIGGGSLGFIAWYLKPLDKN
jgi:hypothetical protein